MSEKDDQSLAYALALSAATGIGPARFRILTQHFGKPKAVWELKESVIEKVLGPKIGTTFLQFRAKTDPVKLLETVRDSGVSLITTDDKYYPKLLKEIDSPPPLLFVKGQLKPGEKCIAVVGSRKVTSYGKDVTQSLVRDLVAAGLTIVSGLARGVDSIAARAALEFGGRTIAVLGGGLNQIYPSENIGLASKIEQNGAVVSEYLPTAPSIPANFPARNRIISGLSLGVLVTEADEISGSLITARFAVEQNREVFAVPGPIYSRLTKGPAGLIKDGAKLVMSAADILEELRIDADEVPREKIRFETEEEKQVFELLENAVVHIDTISRKLGLPVSKISSILSVLELKGIIKSLGGGNYSLKR